MQYVNAFLNPHRLYHSDDIEKPYFLMKDLLEDGTMTGHPITFLQAFDFYKKTGVVDIPDSEPLETRIEKNFVKAFLL